MHSSPGGPIAIIFMMVPLIVVPLIAIFGIPNLPTNLSSAATEESAIEFDDFENKSGDGSSPSHRHSDAPSFDGEEIGDNRDSFSIDDEFGDDSSQYQHGSQNGNRKRKKKSHASAMKGRKVNSSKGRNSHRKRSDSNDVFDDEFDDKHADKFQQKYDDEDKNNSSQNSEQFTNEKNNLLSRRNEENIDEIDFDDSFDGEDSNSDEDDWLDEKALDDSNPLVLTTSENEKQPDNQPASKSVFAKSIRKLRSYGIKNYQMVPGSEPGEFLFRCAAVSSRNSRLVYRFEAEAIEPLDAVEDVLVQVKKWYGKQ